MTHGTKTTTLPPIWYGNGGAGLLKLSDHKHVQTGNFLNSKSQTLLTTRREALPYLMVMNLSQRCKCSLFA